MSYRARLIAVLLITAGCQPHYDGMQIRILTGEGDAIDGEIEVQEGHAMAIEVRPLSSNPHEDYEDFNLVELESFNQTIMLVAPADDVNRFVVAGARPGTSSIVVKIDGRDVDELRGRVLPQQEGP